MYCFDTLLSVLATYCSWCPTLPRDLLISAIDGWVKRHGGAKPPGPEATEEAVQEAFIRALGSTVPQEWTVAQHAAFQDSKQQTTMHGQATGTPYGLMCFGGMELGKLTEIKVKNEVSYLKEHQPHMLQPDLSRVFQGSSSQLSKHVVNITPDGKAGAWSAHTASPALPVGLLGHSVVLYGSRAIIFGGLEQAPVPVLDADAAASIMPTKPPANRTSNKLRAYAVDAAGTQDGLLPVLSDLPQMGPAPSSRMYHTAAVDPDGCLMYVIGGVHIRDRDGARLPADQQAGTLHCYNFHTYTWSTISTTGSCRPCSTTMLAFCWHEGALWAIPDVPTNIKSSSRSSSSSRPAAPPGYKQLRLDVHTKVWQEVAVQGEAPCLRTDACTLYHNGKLLVYGGKTARVPCSMLADLHVLDMDRQPPVWEQVTPRMLADGGSSGGASQGASSSSSSSRQPSLLPLAGHAGGVDGAGCVVFYGGYRRNDVKEPQSVLQVLELGVKPPTPDAALLRGPAAAPLALALQHVRQQVARLVRQHHPKQVLLRPDGGGGVRLPARLLALYSCLFDDMFQDMLAEQEEEGGGAAGGVSSDEPHVVPVPGVSLSGIAGVCRWMMGLLALGSCDMELLVDMYRVADRLIMERLMVEVLDVLGAADIGPGQAAAVLALTGDLSGNRADVASLGARAAQQLRQQVTVVTAPGIMALARQHNNQQLQERCVEVMQGHRKNDVWAVLDFACRFSLPRLQGSCLGHLSQVSRGRLVDKAERVVKVASRRASAAKPLHSLPVVAMLEKDMMVEVSLLEDVSSLPSYAAAAEKLGLRRLQQGLVEAASSAWQQLQDNKQVLQHMQQRFPDLMTEASKKATASRPAAAL